MIYFQALTHSAEKLQQQQQKQKQQQQQQQQQQLLRQVTVSLK